MAISHIELTVGNTPTKVFTSEEAFKGNVAPSLFMLLFDPSGWFNEAVVEGRLDAVSWVIQGVEVKIGIYYKKE